MEKGSGIPEKDSGVQRVRDALYRRGATSKVHPRRKLRSDEDPQQYSAEWDEGAEAPTIGGAEQDPDSVLRNLSEDDQHKKRVSLSEYSMTPAQAAVLEKRKLTRRFIRTLLAASAFFFFIAAGYAAYVFWFGPTQISCDKVRIEHAGPLTIASGKELVLNISVTNGNPVTIHDAVLIVEYPDGTRSPDNVSVHLPSERQTIGTLESGERVRTVTRAALFGKEQEELVIRSALQFTVVDSNHEFYCERPHRIVIATAPVNIEVDGLAEISSNQELELVITVSSNSETTVPNMRLLVDYPYGYDPIAAEPKPTAGDSVWDLGDVEPGTHQTITLRGIVTGIGTEQRNIKFHVGEQDPADASNVSAVLQTVDHPLLVTDPFLALDLYINDNNDPEVSLELGDLVNGRLEWKNNLDYALHDVEIQAQFPGIIVDAKTFKVDSGFYRSVDSTILWTPQTKKQLEKIEPGETGTLTFSFSTYPFVESTSAESPHFDLSFDVDARRISDNVPVQQNLTAQAQRTLKFISNVDVDVYALYAVGPFTNVGPHPPHVNQETTYTITMDVANSTNDLADVTLEAQLPIYITWLDMTDPSTEQVHYNPVTRKVNWAIGDLKAGAGYNEPDRTVSFQISYIPSISQLSSVPAMLDGIVFRGVDQFTGDVIEQKGSRITTRLENDPFFPKDRGSITQ